MNPNAIVEYLRVPADYVQKLGGLRWSDTGEAVEYIEDELSVGLTFVLTGEIANFLAGYGSVRQPIHIGMILHALHLLGSGRTPPPAWATDLIRIFARSGRPLRNAGAFFAVLTEPVPVMPEDIDLRELCRRIASASAMASFAFRWNRSETITSILPPLAFEQFEMILRESLSQYTLEDIDSWFRRGRGPVKRLDEQLARHLHPPRALKLTARLRTILQKARFTGVQGLVATLDSAISLPPRRRSSLHLPIGGYADVSTQGQIDQILPSQLALEPEEFLRRFVSKELLYFHREEPQEPEAQELIVVIDQGIRTWGEPRIILVAALVALVKRAERSKQRLRIVTTSQPGRVFDPETHDDQTLGTLLEASDLTATPAEAIRTALKIIEIGKELTIPTDMIVLTHPRSLASPEVIASLSANHKQTRVFACTADANGSASFAMLEKGVPIAPIRFRVELPARLPSTPKSRLPVQQMSGCWSGDVESMPYPFPIAPDPKSEFSVTFDFDNRGEWLLAADKVGYLYATRADGLGSEMWPRPCVGGLVSGKIHQILGVSGGFVVLVDHEQWYAIAHYQLATRTVRTVKITPKASTPMTNVSPEPELVYLRSYHVVALRRSNDHRLVGVFDLKHHTVVNGSMNPEMMDNFKNSTDDYIFAPPDILIIGPESKRNYGRVPRVRFVTETGQIAIEGVAPVWSSFTPLTDGEPRWRGATMIRAKVCGRVAVFLFRHVDRNRTTHLVIARYRGPTGETLGEFMMKNSVLHDFACSADGAKLATQFNKHQFLIRDSINRNRPGVMTPAPKPRVVATHLLASPKNDPCVQWIIQHDHTFRLCWRENTFTYEFFLHNARSLERMLKSKFDTSLYLEKADLKRRHAPFEDPRFVIQGDFGIRFGVDIFGQIIAASQAGQVVAMFRAEGNKLGAWLPDGTSFGPSEITGRPETLDAAQKIGQALRNCYDAFGTFEYDTIGSEVFP